uniref:Uncharacterized protein n=1 Tax=Arundo donax TaxID=35708 RepID=A0A0A9B1D3_ARUDO
MWQSSFCTRKLLPYQGHGLHSQQSLSSIAQHPFQ